MAELDAKIVDILQQFALPKAEWAIERVREDVEIAQEGARDTAALKLPKEEADAFVKAAKVVIGIARKHDLASEEELGPIRRLGRQANVRLAVTEKPIRRQWLGPSVANFRGAWEAITPRPSGLYYRDEPSPTLAFVTACCKIIDDTVNASTVLRAYREFKSTREMTIEEYGEFCQSDLWRKLTSSDL